jgi:hypothetical protein
MAKVVTEVYPELKEYLVPKCEIHHPFNFCTEAKKQCGKHPTLQEVYRNHLGFGYIVRSAIDDEQPID